MSPSLFSDSESAVLAQEAQASRYVFVSSLVVGAKNLEFGLAHRSLISYRQMLGWDILTNIDDEIELYFARELGLPTFAYLFCRISSVFYALVQTLYVVLDISNCAHLEFVLPLGVAASTNSISFLFLLRVRAIYHESRKAQIFFTTFWLISAACSALFFKFGDGEQSIINPQKCTFGKIHPIFSSVANGLFLVFDTIVYLAISFRLFRIFQFERNLESILLGTGSRNRASSFFTGRCLPAFSRSFLRDGQLFYTMSFFLTVQIIVLYIPPQYNLIPDPLYLVLLNILACYVFRNVKLGKIREESLSISSIHFRSQM
ncbi:hypothetical protein K435DRAFT_785517 [Dendrothele bispora CBS 962.96]|uniref:Uncharacterized protein n=1 Tax=Dendrothele bispora (strain CBS 962.96) TaxID=1314807 RepID=A0A4S8KW94_DENBC|nr:hypothetical protein K435DRAFT_785517 [Dendrothele bispora CBS 962.96]